MSVNRLDFKILITNKINSMKGDFIDLTSGDIHRELGGYSGNNHRIPVCCDTMRELMLVDDEVLESPPKGNGATLKIRYYKRLL